MTRRLLTYLCIDTSGSMKGEPIEAVNAGIGALISSLRQNPYALETVHLSITTFDNEVRCILPVTPLEDVISPNIETPESGATMMGEALFQVIEQVKRDRILHTETTKGDWKPILIILTDGKPTDIYAFNQVVPELKKLNFANIVACAAGSKADSTYLKQITDNVVSLDTMDSNSFSQFFNWVSEAVVQTSQKLNNSESLPPPPKEINIVI